MKTRIGNNILFHGDCLEILPTLPRCCVDAVITDPPYTVSTNAANGGRRQNNELGPHQIDATVKTVGDLSLIEHTFRGWFSEILRVLKSTGRIFVFCNATNYPILMRAAYGRFAYSKLIVWDKTYFGTGGEFRPQHELIFYARCGKAPVIKDYPEQANVIRCKPVPPKKRLHQAQKPVELLKTLLRYCGPVVLDTFMGSGSTLEACGQTGHAGIGIEIERQFYEAAVRRLGGVANSK